MNNELTLFMTHFYDVNTFWKCNKNKDIITMNLLLMLLLCQVKLKTQES